MNDETRVEAKLRYSGMTVLAAEGARIGIITCLRCGAAILIDPRDTRKETGRVLHNKWHEERGL